MLSELQRRVAGIVSALPEARPFVLAGGGALILRGDVDRRTRDLDFFAPEVADVDAMVPALLGILEHEGLDVRPVQVTSGFARLEVSDGRDTTEVDLGTDVTILPAEQREGIAVLSAEELAVDKVLAVFGRAQPRDFVDLYRLEPRFGIRQLFAGAAIKDRGFDPGVFAEMTLQFGRFRPADLGLDEQDRLAVERRVVLWRIAALEAARALGRGTEHNHGLGL
ncbi:MAG TPA: nucleotidyl transferase AbiEii/AbiGii toxin family protein [Acidimicrobiales bacterium]|nr:nucleotidyl transferase AbiEii/AbiGii toxin family protein [Acidimicrobiales bacterium]